MDDTSDEDLVEMGVSQALQRRKILRKVGQARQHGLLVPLSSDPRAIALLLQARALPDDAASGVGAGAGAAETIGRKVVLADAQDVGADADADAVAEEPTPRTRQQQQAMDWLRIGCSSSGSSRISNTGSWLVNCQSASSALICVRASRRRFL